MRIDQVLASVEPLRPRPITESPARLDFLELMQNQISDVNHLQQAAESAGEQLALGNIEFHDAMIISEKANLALQLTMAIRNKVMDAYQEIMRMQV